MSTALAALPAPASPPPVSTLFGCPLPAEPSAFVPPETWTKHALPSLGVVMALPPQWTIEDRGAVVKAMAPDKRTGVVLRHSRLTEPARLPFLRQTVEHAELGPSFANKACEDRLVTLLAAHAGWDPLQVGVYGRPLGDRRRRVAMFAGLAAGSLTAIVSARWRSRARGPDLPLVRRLLGGLRPLP